jgi:two-component system, OmpR family, response regulator
MGFHSDRCHYSVMTGHRPRALVVDDEINIVELLQLVLMSDGYEVQTAGTAAEALARVDEGFSPDVVLLDVMLPDMLGFDLVPILRATDGEMPIVFVTARDAPADRWRGLRVADDYIEKPFSVDELLARVTVAVCRGGRWRRSHCA